MKSVYLTVWCFAWCLACTLSSPADQETIRRPQAEDGGPTRIYIAVGLLDVDEIDSAEQNFTVNLFLSGRWQDPREAHEGPGDRVVPVSEVWNPLLLFVNQQRVWPTLPEVVHITPGGEVEYRQRIWGPFSQPLDMRDFPFDMQDFEIRVAATQFRPDEVVFLADPETPSGLAENFSLPDWEILDWKLDFEPYLPTGSRRHSASFALVLHAKRYASHHVAKIILPLILIVAMSWIVFWVDPEESGTQIGVATTSMLTLIAYRFMVGGMVPPVPYLTRMDYFILGSTLLVFAALAQAVVTSIIARKDKAKFARWIDRTCRLVFPGVFLALIVFAFGNVS